MSGLLIELDEVVFATLIAKGIDPAHMSKAVNEAVMYTYGREEDIAIDLAIAAKFRENRMGITGEEAIAWLGSFDTPNPLPTPKPHYIPQD